jgi:hypothetical protein
VVGDGLLGSPDVGDDILGLSVLFRVQVLIAVTAPRTGRIL